MEVRRAGFHDLALLTVQTQADDRPDGQAAQLVAGAITRHTGAGTVVHLVGAGVVLLSVGLFASRLVGTSLKRGGHLLMALLAGQLVLGLAAWFLRSSGFVRSHESPLGQIAIVTSHVALGALILGLTLVLTVRCFRAAAENRLAWVTG
jgi:cytochrome c oxidase assembly protein subunit 15